MASQSNPLQLCTHVPCLGFARRIAVEIAAKRHYNRKMQLAQMPSGYHVIPLRAATLPPATHINCYIVGMQSALVVDPGSDFPAELERLRAALFSLRGRSGTVQGILLTHHHRDHCAGAHELADEFQLPILAHRATLERLPTWPRSSRAPTRELAHNDRLRVDGRRTLRVLHTPGHAQGHCCLFESRGRVLLSGDVILGDHTPLIDPSDGDMGLYLASLAQLAGYDPSWILPAHGPTRRHGKEIAESLLAHRRWRERLVCECVGHSDHGRTTMEIMCCAYAGALRTPIAVVASYRSTLAHLQKLSAEGRAQRIGVRWRAAGRLA